MLSALAVPPTGEVGNSVKVPLEECESIALEIHEAACLDTLVVAPRLLVRALDYTLDPTLDVGEDACIVGRLVRYDPTAPSPECGGAILRALAREMLHERGYPPDDESAERLARAIAVPRPLVALLARSTPDVARVLARIYEMVPSDFVKHRLPRNRHAS